MDEALIEQQIARVCQVWTDQVHPERILLFGSTACGKRTPGSDLDFLVVWNDESFESNLRRAAYLMRILPNDVRAPIDVIVLTPEQYCIAISDPHTFTSMIVREAKVLYARRA